MYKSITIIYLVVFSVYILFTRQPDYFDGETTKAMVHMQIDSLTKQRRPMAKFTVGNKQYDIAVSYFFSSFQEGQTVELIYENAQPQRASIYNFWGYWIKSGELVITIILYVALFQIAVALNKNPTAPTHLSAEADEPERKRKYD